MIRDAGLPHTDPVHRTFFSTLFFPKERMEVDRLASLYVVLSADDASMIVEEMGLNPIIDVEKAFDIYPE